MKGGRIRWLISNQMFIAAFRALNLETSDGNLKGTFRNAINIFATQSLTIDILQLTVYYLVNGVHKYNAWTEEADVTQWITKLVFCCLLCGAMGFEANANEIHYVEYFIDSDPGPGNGIGLALYTDSISQWVYNPALLFIGLTYGEHVFYVRYRDDHGYFSGAKGKRFYVGAAKKIVSAEEFFDNDPGYGLGQTKFVPDSTDTYSFAPHSHFQNYGQHIFYSRFQTDDGYWGLARPIRINISPGQTFTSAEYFTDVDPGYGNGSPLDPEDYAIEGASYLTTSFQTAGAGKKQFALRPRMSGGYWGVPMVRAVNALPASTTDSLNIGGGEAFFDSDPGVGNGVAMTAVDGGFDELEEQGTATLSTTGLSSGVHTVCMRMKDASQTWTNSLCATVPLPIRSVIQPISTGNPLARNVKLMWEADSLATAYQVHSDSVFTGTFSSFVTVNAPDTTAIFPTPLPLRRFYYVLPTGPTGLFHGIPHAQLQKKSNY